MRFSYDWIQSYFDKPLPKPKELAEILTMHSFEAESDGDILEIEVLPNRAPDCFSHLGVGKECAALLGYELKEPVFDYKADNSLDTKDYLKVEVEDEEMCPRYIALLVKNVKIGESPDWLKKRLASIGQKSINNIVDIGNYVMLEVGQPLHAFDLAKIGGRKIVVRKSKQGEKLITLDNKEINLAEGVLVIADENEPLVVAGIKGGKSSGISTETENIIIEAAIFNPFSIRQSSKSVGIKTDASIRFEHGVSLFLAEKGIKRMASLIQEMGIGEPAAKFIDASKEKPVVPRVLFSKDDVSKLLGKEISQSEIERILKSLKFHVSKLNSEKLSDSLVEVVPPPERLDINIKEDVIEEIARVYGYGKIPAEMPLQTSEAVERNDEYFYSTLVRGILVESGFTEVYNYSFSNNGPEDLKLENPVSSTKSYLRINLAEGLKRVIENNFKYFDEVKIFEVGKVFDGGREKVKIGIAIGYRKDEKKQKEVPLELKGAVDTLLEKLGITEPLESEKITEGVCEIDLDEIIELAADNIDFASITQPTTEDIEYKPFSKYPAVVRDISLFVPLDTSIEEVADVIENTGGELLADCDLFDEYMPDFKTPAGQAGKKSLAFRLIFQSFERTLTDNEVNNIRDKIISALEENEEWEVRK